MLKCQIRPHYSWQGKLTHYSLTKLACLTLHQADFSLMERGVQVTTRRTWQVLLRMSLSKGPIRVGAGLDHRENRATADVTIAKHQVHLLPHCGLMTALHLIFFLSPIQILCEFYCFVFLE